MLRKETCVPQLLVRPVFEIHEVCTWGRNERPLPGVHCESILIVGSNYHLFFEAFATEYSH